MTFLSNKSRGHQELLKLSSDGNSKPAGIFGNSPSFFSSQTQPNQGFSPFNTLRAESNMFGSFLQRGQTFFSYPPEADRRGNLFRTNQPLNKSIKDPNKSNYCVKSFNQIRQLSKYSKQQLRARYLNSQIKKNQNSGLGLPLGSKLKENSIKVIQHFEPQSFQSKNLFISEQKTPKNNNLQQKSSKILANEPPGEFNMKISIPKINNTNQIEVTTNSSWDVRINTGDGGKIGMDFKREGVLIAIKINANRQMEPAQVKQPSIPAPVFSIAKSAHSPLPDPFTHDKKPWGLLTREERCRDQPFQAQKRSQQSLNLVPPNLGQPQQQNLQKQLSEEHFRLFQRNTEDPELTKSNFIPTQCTNSQLGGTTQKFSLAVLPTISQIGSAFPSQASPVVKKGAEPLKQSLTEFNMKISMPNRIDSGQIELILTDEWNVKVDADEQGKIGIEMKHKEILLQISIHPKSEIQQAQTHRIHRPYNEPKNNIFEGQPAWISCP